MSVFVRILTIPHEVLLNFDFVQDLDGNGEIGLQEVSGSLLVCDMNLILRAPVQAPVGLCQSRGSYRRFSMSLTPLARSNGERCSSPLTTTKMAS